MDCLHREANGAVIAGWPTHTMSFPCGEEEQQVFKRRTIRRRKVFGKDQTRKSRKMMMMIKFRREDVKQGNEKLVRW